MTRALICGGRDFVDADLLTRTMNRLRVEHQIDYVISGGAHGADTLGELWAKSQGIGVKRFPADWKAHGRSAGPIRNRQMLDEGQPDLIVAFPGGRGTAHMVKISKARSLPVIEVKA